LAWESKQNVAASSLEEKQLTTTSVKGLLCEDILLIEGCNFFSLTLKRQIELTCADFATL
jgi:hypothetical protein